MFSVNLVDSISHAFCCPVTVFLKISTPLIKIAQFSCYKTEGGHWDDFYM
jgi:hypothetical protein